MTDERMELEGTSEAAETADQNAEKQAETKPEEVAASGNGDISTSESAEPVQPEIEEHMGHVDYSQTFRTLTQGDVVDGVVVHIDKEGVLVDVGTKSEGIIRPNELTPGPVQAAEDVVAVGDRIDVYVMRPENEEGNPVLSKKRADFESAWERVQEAFEDGRELHAMVTERVKGGLVVDLGIRGFVPGSHVGTGRVKNLERYVGQSLPLKVIDVDRERRKVVLSHRLAVEEEREKQRRETVATLVEGQVREGIVRRITDYGAFIDLGGIDGLLHVSEMSWTRINHPSDVVKVGQKLQVMVLKLNLEAGRVSLGLRQILPDPWVDVADRYKVGQIITGTISRIVPFGAFIQLEEGIEGIIPNSELSHRRVKKPEDVVSVNQAVEVKIIDLRPEERRMTLSIRQTQEDRERKEYEGYRSTTRAESGAGTGMTLGDLMGDKFQELMASARGAEEEAKAEAEEQPAEAVVEEQEAVVAEEPSAEPAQEPEAPVEAEAEAATEPEAEVEAPEVAEAEVESESAPEATEPEAAVETEGEAAAEETKTADAEAEAPEVAAETESAPEAEAPAEEPEEKKDDETAS